ncbi:unnamed protein product [Cyclocybe aegerita]|uniref:Uncharacterized protein n=1 Tax=Cyclocybe aegerita TaxID=1973307 RepID=A0A8S0WG35_CYCAE|nr:unnamed protein product [Cyclocybe aegerita]
MLESAFNNFRFSVSVLLLVLGPIFVAAQEVIAPPGFNMLESSLHPSQRTSNGLPIHSTSFGINGTGCPPGSAYYVLSSDRRSVDVKFTSYFAAAGPNIPMSSNRKGCQLVFGVSIPPGFSFGVASLDYLLAPLAPLIRWRDATNNQL